MSSKVAVWTVDHVARLIEIKQKEFLFIYLHSVAHDPKIYQKYLSLATMNGLIFNSPDKNLRLVAPTMLKSSHK